MKDEIYFGRNYISCPKCSAMTLTWELYCLKCETQFHLAERDDKDETVDIGGTQNERWNEIEAVVIDGDMQLDARNTAAVAIDELRSQFSDHEALIALQHRRTVDADRIYQEVHGWPNTQFPDLGELIWWLLDERERLREVGIIAKDMMAYVDMGGTTDKKFSDFIEQFRLAFGGNNVQDQP